LRRNAFKQDAATGRDGPVRGDYLIHVNIREGALDYLRALGDLGDERCASS
jgi:hypothetical protein